MSDLIKINTNADFFKDFEIETPGETIQNAEDALTELRKEVESQEQREKPIEDLLQELNKEDKSSEENKEEKKEDNKKLEEKKEEKKEDENKTEYSFKPFIDIMAEQGILDTEDLEDLGDTAEDLVEAFEYTVTNRINKGIDDYKESVPELGKQFLEYLEQGGDPKKFLQAQSGPIDFDSLDMSDESNQKAVIRELLKAQEYSNEEINETIKDYEDSLLLEKQSKLAIKKLQVIDSKRSEQLLKDQEREVKQREKDLNNYVSDIQKIIKESKEIAGLEIDDKEKAIFEAYLFKRDKAGLTPYQKDLQENPNKTQVELAYLKFKKYDFAKAAKKAESTAAKKIRDSIVSKNETTVKGSTADISSNRNDFEAFKTMLSSMRK